MNYIILIMKNDMIVKYYFSIKNLQKCIKHIIILDNNQFYS